MLGLILVPSALAGPPYHGCDVDKHGTVALFSPGDGKLAVLDGASLKVITERGKPSGHWVHLLYAHPEGGWWLGAQDTVWIKPDGSVEPDANPQPSAMWEALARGEAAAQHGGNPVLWDPNSVSVVAHDTAGAVRSLWTITDHREFPKGLSVVGDTVYAIQNFGIRAQPLAGPTSQVPEPKREVVGICGVPDGPLYAAVWADEYAVCLLTLEGDSWREVACLPPPPPPKRP